MKVALYALLPALLPAPTYDFEVFDFSSKERLLAKLPDRLMGYASMIRSGGYDDLRVVVLVDRDDEDCRVLKERLEKISQAAGLHTKTTASVLPTEIFHVVNRIVCEELEAWFLGDLLALQNVYPRLTARHFNKNHLQDPDSVKGGTWEALLRALQKANYYLPPLANNSWKYELAKRVGPYLNLTPRDSLNGNRSVSFQYFIAGIKAVMQQR